jgi:hypothetical protein
MIASDRARINLPSRMVDDVRSEAHRWYAEELLILGRAAEARPHFLTALRLDPQLRTAGLFAMSVLPPRARDGVRKIARSILRR